MKTAVGEAIPATAGITPEERSFSNTVRAITTVWQRELIRFSRSKMRVVTSFAQPVLYLFVFGTGLGSLVGRASVGFDFKMFLFPGVLGMTVLFSAVFSAVSIVWDREFGFLREMLVAPVPRSGIVMGKALGGASVATVQGALILVLAPFAGIRLTPVIVIEALAIMALLAFCLTSLGIVVASRMQRIESFQAVMQFFLMPIFFLSGALFPIGSLPSWLGVLVRINPMTYAVVALRRVMFSADPLPPDAAQAAGLNITWGGWTLPTWMLLIVVAVFGVLALTASVLTFRQVE